MCRRLPILLFFKKLLCPVAFWVCSSLPTFAQIHLPEPSLFTSLEFEQINRIEQDDRGLLWLVTNRGLFCFDGIFFKKVQHSSYGVSAIDNGRVEDLYIDQSRGNLWLATPEGVSALDLKTETFTDYTFSKNGGPGVLDGESTAIMKSRQGDLWFGVCGLGLVRFDSCFHYFPMHKDSLLSAGNDWPIIYQIVQDAIEDSILWIASGYTGLIRFNSTTGRFNIPNQHVLKHAQVGVIFTKLLPTPEKIYLGNTWSEQSFIYNIKKHSFIELKNTNPGFKGVPLRLSNIQAHTDNTFWGINNSGLFFFDSQTDSLLQWFPKPESEKMFTNGFLAKPDRLWIGTENGLLLYDFSTYRIQNHLIRKTEAGAPNFLSSALEKPDSSGLLLAFLFSEHLYDYDLKSRKAKKIPAPNQAAGTPRYLLPWKNKILGIAARGFYEVRNDRLVLLPIFKSLARSNIEFKSPYLDKNGFLWLGSTWGALYKMNLEYKQYSIYAERLGYNGITSMFKDQDDNIWMGGRGGGGYAVYQAKKDTILHFPYQRGASNTIHYPRGIAQDEAGNIWMSDIRVGGLLKLDPNRIEAGVLERHVGRAGRYSNHMFSLQADKKGRIWAVTEEGLQVFDPKNGMFRLFGSSAGFRLRARNRLWSNLLPSYLTRLSNGEMLVGHNDGFALFHPDSLLAIKVLPKPYLLALQVDKKNVYGVSFQELAGIELKYNENMLEFEFSALSWYDSEKTAFSYRLKGLNEQWKTTSQRMLRFVHLPPGDYTFELHALNSVGDKREKPLAVHFTILPPWWLTWWAYCMYATLLSSIFWRIYTFQKRRWQLKAQLDLEHREAERLKELDAVKSKLYTNITHEFRTPLTIILGMAQQVQDKPKDWFRLGTQMIIRNGENLLLLVNQMLDLSKLESGSMPVNFIQADILADLKYIFESFRSLAESKNIQLDIQTTLEELTMDYDPEKLREIVSNLLSNAIKFTSAGGSVQLTIENSANGETQNPESTSKEKEKVLILKAQDTGIGIPKEKIPYIFDRFYQADDASNRKAEGTGIGLALTKELVKLLNGKITVSSDVGLGTRFEVVLPITNTAPFQTTEQLPSTKTEQLTSPGEVLSEDTVRDSTKPLLLVAEDNIDLTRYLKSFLQEYYYIEVAENGQQGIEKALKSIPDIIISDVMMPIMDGYELCNVLKTDIRTSHIPIVLLTAKADVFSRISGLKRGADAYLAKPFHKEELLLQLQNLVTSRRKLQERYRSITSPPSENIDIQMEDAFLKKVREILEDHLSDEHFSILNICQELGMSRAQLYRKFKALTDQPIGHYFRSLRLYKARELLLNTNLHISEIAYAVGFKDPAYFTRVFKETFGTNPSDVRK